MKWKKKWNASKRPAGQRQDIWSKVVLVWDDLLSALWSEQKANLTSITPHPRQLAWWEGGYFWTIYFQLRWCCVGILWPGPHLSCKQPTGSVSVSLVVGQEGRGEAGVGGVVRDAVLGVEKTLGVCRVDERWRTSVEDALGGGNLESSLQPGRHYQGGTSQSSALSDHGGLWGHGGLQGLVSDLQSRRSGGLQTSCNGEIFL